MGALLKPGLGLAFCLAGLVLCGNQAFGQTHSSQSKPSSSSSAPTTSAEDQSAAATKYRDGQHDFDFNDGAWKTHMSVLRSSPGAAKAWLQYKGTVTVRKVWGGRASLEEVEVDGAAGHLEELVLRLYNPKAHQWSLNFANSEGGTLSVPMVGEFNNGVGEFIDQEPFHGRSVLFRTIWSNISSSSYHFEQAFSDDEGKTWDTNIVATVSR